MSIKVLTLLSLFSAVYCVYNPEIWYINAKSPRKIILNYDKGYYAYNVGNTNITARVLSGGKYGWYDPIEEKHLAPGEGHVFFTRQTYLRKALEIVNHGDRNCFVHGYGLNLGYPDFDDSNPGDENALDKEELLKAIITTGAEYIPVVGEALSGIIEYFWPDEDDDLWNKVKKQLNNAIKQNGRVILNAVLEGDIEQIKTKIKTVNFEIEHPNITKTLNEHYMAVAQNLVGLEKKFMTRKSTDPDYIDTNYIILPLYSLAVNLKLEFYQYGIRNKDKIGLTSEHELRLRYYLNNTVFNEAVNHVETVYKEKLNDKFVHAYATTLYDELAAVRTYCTLNGFEHSDRWKLIPNNPEITQKPKYASKLVFPNNFGRTDAKLVRAMVSEKMPEPLQPPIVNGEFENPIYIDVFLTSKKNPRIGGLKVRYNDADSVFVGPKTVGYRKGVTFMDSNLVKLIVRGTGQINELEFHFDDGRVQKVGSGGGDTKEFSLSKHRIVGFYMTGSIKISCKQAANIAVSYQLVY